MIATHEVGRLFGKLSIFCDAVSSFKVEVKSNMHAAIAKMTVKRTPIAELVDERVEVAQIAADVVGVHCRVLPPLVVVLFPWDLRGGAQPFFPKVPNILLQHAIVQQLVAGSARVLIEVVQQPARRFVSLLLSRSAKLDEKPGSPIGQKIQVLGM